MKKACIFDLDGTLTDTLDSLTFSVNATLKEMGLGSITREQCRSFVGDGARCLIERSLRVSGDESLVRIEEGMRIYGRIFKENCNYHVKPYEGVCKTLEALKFRGIRLAVLSNKPHPQTIDVVETFLGKEIFDRIQGQCEDFPRKPDPTAVRDILCKFKVKPGECIYIGDSEVDMKTGKAAGVFTVGANWGFRSRELLEQNGADVTIDHMEELLQLIVT
ncbi:MAG: HAD family hydrolase [Coprococcus sp.]|nr:HAD family hydrolase [Coprococcus sp.]